VLQIIEEDKTKSVHYVYRKWGRVGTSRIGGDKLEKLEKVAAIKEFKRLFREKTGNDWESWEKQENFEKQPGKFYPVEIVRHCIFLTGCAACSTSLVMTVVFHFSIC
jgi:poly [ADP-ribose] polymerase